MKKQKIINVSLVSLFLLVSVFPLISGQDIIATKEDTTVAGITPDTPILWGIDRAIERVTELFSENAKLNHAKERLAEVKVMIEKNKIDKAEKSIKNFDKLKLRVKDQSQIQEHIKLMDSLGQKISLIPVQGDLTEEQRNDIKKLIFQHKEEIQEENNNIDNESKLNDIINKPQQIINQN